MEEMKEKMDKMKNQIKSLRISFLVLGIGFLILTICFWSRYFQIQNSLSSIVRCLNLIHQLILSMH